jgi:hypothetical protein
MGLTKAMMHRSRHHWFSLTLCAVLLCHAGPTVAQQAMPEAALKPFEAGMAHAEREQYQAAIAAFTKAKAAHSAFVEAYCQRSQIYSRLGNPENRSRSTN